MKKSSMTSQKGEIHKTECVRSNVEIRHAKVRKLYSTITEIKVRVREIENQMVYYIYLGPDAMVGRTSIPAFAVSFPTQVEGDVDER